MRSKIFLIIILINFFSCTKEVRVLTPQAPVYLFSIHLKPDMNGQKWMADTLIYQNKAGSMYSINRYQSFLSEFRFYKNGNLVEESPNVFYYDAFDTSTWNLTFKNLHVAAFDEVHFLTGINNANNLSNALEPTVQNINMAWPDEMGGGYHFLKMEGKFLDNSNNRTGYAMHLGKNGFQSPAYIYVNRNLRTDTTTLLELGLHVYDWLAARQPYDFNIQGPYTMNNDSLMLILKNNGTQVYFLR